MIISGGENIASSEVERVIYQLPEVREAAVIGLPDDRNGASGRRGRRAECGRRARSGDTHRHCRAHLAGFKVPKELVLREQLPRNPSGKMLKRVLRAELGG